ncbi:hypothetical protein, conserved [Eimeria necatrix]|uniref:Protein RFT1 homolog n=1 Tax=Eimeria necatrix TaxID=51315 RepID=U6MSX3_9EIME|nr:hypothetical protein, conserved [Eimeria necatrix]CDJ67317.1 hypothetical protein, conserved [Eimeria necatrix]
MLAALRRSFGKYISTAHMQFLPVYLMLLAQKLVLQNGEQLLLLLLLDSKAAAEYALVSGAASVICRVVFAPTESAAFDSFRVLQAQHSGGDRAAAQAAPDAGRLFPSSSIAACKKQHVSSAGKQVVKEPFCTRRKTCSPKSREGKREQHIDYRHREELAQFCCVERKELLESDSNRRTGTDRGEAGPLESMFLGRLMTLLSRLNSPSKITQSVRRPLYSPALSLLQLLLLLQGTLGLASAAAGVLFAAPALRCVFGPSTVASGSGCVLTLQVYCCYVGCLSLFGLLDAYAAATSSSTSLELLQRCYSGATAAHLILMPLSVRFAIAYGVPSGAGAAAAQVVGTIIRISCCCLSISSDMRTASKLRPMNRHFSLETSAAAQRSISQGHSGSFGRNTGKHDSSQSVSASSEAIDIEGMARRNAAVKHPPGTTATLAYDMQQVFLGKYAISLWVAEIALGLLVCVASFAVVGPLLMQYVREAYSSCHAI